MSYFGVPPSSFECLMKAGIYSLLAIFFLAIAILGELVHPFDFLFGAPAAPLAYLAVVNFQRARTAPSMKETTARLKAVPVEVRIGVLRRSAQGLLVVAPVASFLIAQGLHTDPDPSVPFVIRAVYRHWGYGAAVAIVPVAGFLVIIGALVMARRLESKGSAGLGR